MLPTPFRYKLFIAWRYFHSKKSYHFSSRISNITLMIITLTTAIPLITSSIMNGFHESLIEKHIHKDFHIHIIPKYKAKYYKSFLKKVQNIALLAGKIKGIYPFYENQALIISKNGEYFPIAIRALSPEAYFQDPSLKKHFPLIAGQTETTKNFHITIGKELARALHSTEKEYQNFLKSIHKKHYPPIKILLLPETHKNSPQHRFRTQTLLVSGLFSSGYHEYDTYYSFTTLTTGQILYNARTKTQNHYKGHISGLGIKLHNRKHSDLISQILKKQFPNHTIYTWKEANKNLLYALEWEKTLTNIILALMITTSIIITIYINANILVLEKKQEIGILRAFGVSPKTIQHIFLIKGFLTGLLGASFGIILSIIFLISLQPLISIIENTVQIFQSFLSTNPENNRTTWKLITGDLRNLQFSLYAIKSSDFSLLGGLAILITTFGTYFPTKRNTKKSIITNIHHD